MGWVSLPFRLEAFALRDAGQNSNKLLGTQSGSSYMELCCPVSKIANLFCVTIPGKGKRSVSLPEAVAVPAGSEQLKLSEINTP